MRALLAGAVQRRDRPLPALVRELCQGQRRHSARLRRVLEEVADGVRSVTEAEFRDLIRRARLPRADVQRPAVHRRRRLHRLPRCLVARGRVAAEIDSREWHLNPANWERTMRRHARMSRHGILVLHLTPRQIRVDPAAVVAVMKGTLAAGTSRVLLLPLIARWLPEVLLGA